MSTGSLARALFILAALLSPFLFPYPFTLLLSFIASLFVPFVAIAVGLITDAVYFVPHITRFPLATFMNVFIFIIAFFVRRFIKARIMGG